MSDLEPLKLVRTPRHRPTVAQSALLKRLRELQECGCACDACKAEREQILKLLGV